MFHTLHVSQMNGELTIPVPSAEVQSIIPKTNSELIVSVPSIEVQSITHFWTTNAKNMMHNNYWKDCQEHPNSLGESSGHEIIGSGS
ncbi:hypothetical protein V6N12_040924 [Hibiscus sabdariffa]|uniref:Uncharacterized protein n=1 Tax=Hibiscus sabdariffa TaxID=183260 RepID=A0ABR2E739_9ROSI